MVSSEPHAERLGEHVTNDACAGCHELMDPIGLAFENFDAIGAYRAQENGVEIDASGNPRRTSLRRRHRHGAGAARSRVTPAPA